MKFVKEHILVHRNLKKKKNIFLGANTFSYIEINDFGLSAHSYSPNSHSFSGVDGPLKWIAPDIPKIHS